VNGTKHPESLSGGEKVGSLNPNVPI
jgi:hypothetical protein